MQGHSIEIVGEMAASSEISTSVCEFESYDDLAREYLQLKARHQESEAHSRWLHLLKEAIGEASELSDILRVTGYPLQADANSN